MAENTHIEWTTDPNTKRPGSTWSIVTGCTDADESCLWCYAKRLTATRLRKQPKYEGLASVGRRGPQWSGELRLHPELLGQPLKWKSRRRIFVCSMSDLFHDDVPFDFIARAWAAMSHSYQHRGHLHLCLTKRTRRARLLLSGELPGDDGEPFQAAVNRHFLAMREEYGFARWSADGDFEWPLPGIHLGMSAGRQKEAVERWRDLSHTPIQARFMSIEPIIGPVDLYDVLADEKASSIAPDQVIVGGESGTRQRCRPPFPGWFHDLRYACRALGVPFFFKQWGNWRVADPELADLVVYYDGSIESGEIGSSFDYAHMVYGTKKAAGRKIDGRTFDGYPDACPSCYRPLDGVEATHGCPGCDAFVCNDCKVNALNRSAVCSGMCRGCWKDGKTLLRSEVA